MTISYKGQSAVIGIPGWYCHESGESIHTAEDMKVSDKALKHLKMEVEKLLKPAEVRRIRADALKLSQAMASKIIGGGPNWFQKYDSGEVVLSRAASNLLRVLEHRPQELEFLEQFQVDEDPDEDDVQEAKRA